MTKHRAQKLNAADRDAIRSAGTVQFLLDIVAGKPAPVRDAAGRIVDWTDPPELPLRVSTATSLVRKVLPDLQAQAIDVTSHGEGVLRIVLADGLEPPGGGNEITRLNAPEEIIPVALDTAAETAEIPSSARRLEGPATRFSGSRVAGPLNHGEFSDD